MSRRSILNILQVGEEENTKYTPGRSRSRIQNIIQVGVGVEY